MHLPFSDSLKKNPLPMGESLIRSTLNSLFAGDGHQGSFVQDEKDKKDKKDEKDDLFISVRVGERRLHLPSVRMDITKAFSPCFDI